MGVMGKAKQLLKKIPFARKAVYRIRNRGNSGDVIFPRIMDKQYNKRIHNYVLATHLGESINRWVVEQMSYRVTGRFPDLDHPVGFNDKMQWMRLHYHDPLMTKCVDKCSFKDYIRETVGEQYVVPLYGVWNNVNDIDFDALPDSFVLKSTWGWGDLQNILVKKKEKLNVNNAKAVMAEWLMPWNNYYYQSFEWDCKDIPPRIIAEKLLQPSGGEIVDYKFYCFNGVCKYFLVCRDRKTETKYINYDLDFNCLRLSPNSYVTKKQFRPPENFREMLSLAEKLAKPFPLVRVDFYDVDGKIYVGEMTFSPGGGFNTYYDEWDRKIGSFLTLPEANVPEKGAGDE
ncbi:MAG: glycosyl transferase [Oscillospiraceae bacterium]|nr:glycosyl transferase [Oscillospiraceae bacterium]